MVSVIFCVVSVWLVIDPCVKLGTTGTAIAGDPSKNATRNNLFMTIYLTYLIVISETNCPVALVPAPPAVNDIVPAELIVPAREPATPPAVVVTLPNAGRDGTTPLVTVVPVGIASPAVNDSLNEKASPAVV